MILIGWIVWSVLLLINLSLSWGIYDNHRRGKWFPNQIETVAIWYLILIWSAFSSLSKLHLLWLAPIAFALPFVVWTISISSLRRPSLHLVPWLAVFGVLLALLTW